MLNSCTATTYNDFMQSNHPLVHKTKARFKALQIPSQKTLAVAVSGGKDSVALLFVLAQIQRMLGMKLVVFHVHHGESSGQAQKAYRDQCQRLVGQLAQQLDCRFFTNTSWPTSVVSSEEGLRERRHHLFAEWSNQLLVDGSEEVVLCIGHHSQDALETQLIQLIRGSGVRALTTMGEWDGQILRPFLTVAPSEIQSFIDFHALTFYEDPSNQDVEYFRNWVRHKWLPELDAFREGASKSLARSFQNIRQQLQDAEHNGAIACSSWSSEGLPRKDFCHWSHSQKTESLAKYLSQLGIKGYTSNHIEEFVKRLDTNRNELTFEMLSMSWKITKDRIQASRV